MDKPQVLTWVRFKAAPPDLPARVTATPEQPIAYAPSPLPHVKVGGRRFPWHEVAEFQLPTDKAAEARKK